MILRPGTVPPWLRSAAVVDRASVGAVVHAPTRFVPAHQYCCQHACRLLYYCRQPAGGWRARGRSDIRGISHVPIDASPRGGRTKPLPASPDRAARAHVARCMVSSGGTGPIQKPPRFLVSTTVAVATGVAARPGLGTSSRRARRRRLTRPSNRNRCRSISRACRRCAFLLTPFLFTCCVVLGFVLNQIYLTFTKSYVLL